jgi:hypothetical protein
MAFLQIFARELVPIWFLTLFFLMYATHRATTAWAAYRTWQVNRSVSMWATKKLNNKQADQKYVPKGRDIQQPVKLVT